jgi:hypothetical protein
MSEFCGGCEFLNPTEYNQLKGDIHWCSKFNTQVLHDGYHPNIKRASECLKLDNTISFEKAKKEAEEKKNKQLIKWIIENTKSY